jgi:hypothetical protein
MPPRKRLGQLLTELGVIDEHQLQSALGHQKQWGGKLGAILVQKGFCSEDQMVSALTQHLALPRVKLAAVKIDPRAQKCVTRQIAEKLHVFPYELSGSGRSEVVTVAMSDPTDLSAVDQLAFHTGKRIKPMLAGDSEVLNAIHAHYPAPDDKKEATDKLGQRSTAPLGGTASRRIDPPAPVAPPRPSPYIPPPIPPARSPARTGELEEIEPDEVMAPPADTPKAAPAPLDLPEAEAEGMGLEPIAAHSQSAEGVAGQEELGGEGSAADAVEGLVPDTIGNVAAEGAGWPKGEEADRPDAAWGAPAQAEAPGWGEASEDVPVDDAGWGAETEAQPVDVVGEELPADAIVASAPGAQPSGWGTATEEAPAASSFEALPGPGDAAASAEVVDATDAEHAAPGEQEAGSSAGAVVEEVPVELNGDEEPVEETAGPGPATEGSPPEEAADEAEAPDAWASSDDPLAAQGDDVPAWAGVPREDSADHAAGPGATQQFANPVDQAADAQGEPEPAGEPAPEEPVPEWGGTGEAKAEEEAADEIPLEEAPAEDLRSEQAPQEDGVQEAPQEDGVQASLEAPGEEGAQPEAPEAAGEYAEQGEEGGMQPEGWAAPPGESESQEAGWMPGTADASVPLAPADYDALASVGLDPGDGVGALRLLAALVRILQRRQLVDPEEVAAEIRESLFQGAAAAAEQPGAYEEGPASGDPAADPGPAER